MTWGMWKMIHEDDDQSPAFRHPEEAGRIITLNNGKGDLAQ
jgi:hypothetical protein